jgi:DnaD/phage-associated family protein
MTTLRRELRTKFEGILQAFEDILSIAVREGTAELLADAALELRAFQFDPEVKKTNIFELYESNIGPLTPMIADSLGDAEKLYDEQWIADAIRLAVEHNKRNWKYCEAILKRWKEEGKDEGKKKTDETKVEYDSQGIIKSW